MVTDPAHSRAVSLLIDLGLAVGLAHPPAQLTVNVDICLGSRPSGSTARLERPIDTRRTHDPAFTPPDAFASMAVTADSSLSNVVSPLQPGARQPTVNSLQLRSAPPPQLHSTFTVSTTRARLVAKSATLHPCRAPTLPRCYHGRA
jgi:hypothetical protein